MCPWASGQVIKVFAFKSNGQGSLPSRGTLGKCLKTLATCQTKPCEGNLEASSRVLAMTRPIYTESTRTIMAHKIP